MLLEAPQPVLAERAALREAVGGEIAELVIVLVDARDRRGDGLKGEPVVDELTDELDERGVYGCRPSRALVRLLVCWGRRGRRGGGLVGARLVTE